MRKLIVYTAALLLFAGCKKAYIINDPDNFTIGSYLKLEKADKTTLDYNKIASESVTITTTAVGSEIEKVNIFVVAGAGNLDATKWKLVKSVPATASPITLTVTATELATALGIQPTELNPDNQYTY